MQSTWLLRHVCASTVALVTFGAEQLAFGCSGPGAMAAILRAERLGWMLWGVNLLLVGAAALIPRVRAGGWRKLRPLLLLVVLHPGCWLSARMGDCGMTRLEGSVVFLALTPLVVGFLFWRTSATSDGMNRSNSSDQGASPPSAPST